MGHNMIRKEKWKKKKKKKGKEKTRLDGSLGLACWWRLTGSVSGRRCRCSTAKTQRCDHQPAGIPVIRSQRVGKHIKVVDRLSRGGRVEPVGGEEGLAIT